MDVQREAACCRDSVGPHAVVPVTDADGNVRLQDSLHVTDGNVRLQDSLHVTRVHFCVCVANFGSQAISQLVRVSNGARRQVWAVRRPVLCSLIVGRLVRRTAHPVWLYM